MNFFNFDNNFLFFLLPCILFLWLLISLFQYHFRVNFFKVEENANSLGLDSTLKIVDKDQTQSFKSFTNVSSKLSMSQMETIVEKTQTNKYLFSVFSKWFCGYLIFFMYIYTFLVYDSSLLLQNYDINIYLFIIFCVYSLLIFFDNNLYNNINLTFVQFVIFIYFFKINLLFTTISVFSILNLILFIYTYIYFNEQLTIFRNKAIDYFHILKRKFSSSAESNVIADNDKKEKKNENNNFNYIKSFYILILFLFAKLFINIVTIFTKDSSKTKNIIELIYKFAEKWRNFAALIVEGIDTGNKYSNILTVIFSSVYLFYLYLFAYILGTYSLSSHLLGSFYFFMFILTVIYTPYRFCFFSEFCFKNYDFISNNSIKQLSNEFNESKESKPVYLFGLGGFFAEVQTTIIKLSKYVFVPGTPIPKREIAKVAIGVGISGLSAFAIERLDKHLDRGLEYHKQEEQSKIEYHKQAEQSKIEYHRIAEQARIEEQRINEQRRQYDCDRADRLEKEKQDRDIARSKKRFW